MLLQVIIPLIYSEVISSIMQENTRKIFIFLIWIFILYISELILSLYEGIINLKVVKYVNLKVKEKYVKRIFETNFYYNEEEDHGKLFNNIMSDTVAVTSYIASVIKIISIVINVGITAMIIFLISWEMALVLCLFYPIGLLVSHIYNKKIKLISIQLFEQTDKICGFAKNVIGNIRDIKNQRGEEVIEKKFIHLVDEGRKVAIQQGSIKIWQFFLTSFIKFINYFVYMCLGIILLLCQKISLGIFTAFGVYAKNLSSDINSLLSIIAELQPIKVCLDRLLEIDRKYEKSTKNNIQRVVLDCINEIVLDDITICFGEKEIIKEVKCKFQKGKIYGICGGNGAGKTSIGNLLMGNIQLANGTIHYNNINLSLISPESLHNQISYVGANKIVYYMSLIENICMSKPENSNFMELAVSASKIVSLDEFIQDNRLLDKEIGDNCNLSSGQIQKLQLARMIVKGGSVLIFDEALSNLDVEVRKKMHQYIKKESKNKIVIIISHNPDDYVICSEVYRIENQKLIIAR